MAKPTTDSSFDVSEIEGNESSFNITFPLLSTICDDGDVPNRHAPM